MAHEFVIWRDVPEVVVHNEKGERDFDAADIPCVRYNEQTKQFEPVINHRGRAYAARKRMKYRNKRR